MSGLHIETVDVVDGGVVVTYDDDSCAFYEEAVLMTHVAAGMANEALEKKAPAPARMRLKDELRVRA